MLNNLLLFANEKTWSVFCANKGQKWYWLKDSNDQFIKVKGELKMLYYFHEDEVLSLEYFNISGDEAENKVKDLEQNCIDNYGPDFEFA